MFKAEHSEIATVSFRQDNVGCYHSGTLLASCSLIQQTTGIQIGRVDFSDPQGGKGPCDRKAATIKAHVRCFIDEGHGVLTTEDLSNGGVRGVRVAVINAEWMVPTRPIQMGRGQQFEQLLLHK